jgi:hypothetical protein
MLDVRVNFEKADCYVTYQACCEHTAAEIEAFGYEFVTGRTIESVVAEITGHDVLEVTGHGDGAVVCRLEMMNPTKVTDKTDKHGHAKAASFPGWQTQLFGQVDAHHRHHDAPQGWKFGIAVYNGPVRVGIAIVGRPASKELQKAQPDTLEVSRVCTWGHPELRKNASSKLYAAAAKQARALGYDKLITYTIHGEESGHSVRTAGWSPTHISDGGSWDRPSRPRQDKAPTGRKVRWEKGLTKKMKRAVAAAAIELDEQPAEIDRLAAK